MIASSVGTNGSSSSTMETTVSAPNGLGMPWNMPSRIGTQENRASRSTTASSTTIAATTDTRWCASSATMPQVTTKYAGARPKLIRSERLSSSAPIAELRSLRATSPSKRSKTDASSIRITAVAALCRAMPPSSLPVRCGMRTPVVVKYTAMKPQVALPRVRVSAIDSRVDSGMSSLVLVGLGRPSPPVSRDQSRSRRVTPAVVAWPTSTADLDALREVDVDARAEADQSDPLTLLDLGALRARTGRYAGRPRRRSAPSRCRRARCRSARRPARCSRSPC